MLFSDAEKLALKAFLGQKCGLWHARITQAHLDESLSEKQLQNHVPQ